MKNIAMRKVKLVLKIALMVVVGATSTFAKEKQPPNIIVIIVDDLGKLTTVLFLFLYAYYL